MPHVHTPLQRLAFRISVLASRTGLTASYTYAPLGQFKAHLFGAGVEIRF